MCCTPNINPTVTDTMTWGYVCSVSTAALTVGPSSQCLSDSPLNHLPSFSLLSLLPRPFPPSSAPTTGGNYIHLHFCGGVGSWFICVRWRDTDRLDKFPPHSLPSVHVCDCMYSIDMAFKMQNAICTHPEQICWCLSAPGIALAATELLSSCSQWDWRLWW